MKNASDLEKTDITYPHDFPSQSDDYKSSMRLVVIVCVVDALCLIGFVVWIACKVL